MSDASETTAPAATPTPTPAPPLPELVTRSHSITVGGQELAYTTTIGYMPIRNEKGDLTAKLFYTAYSLDGVADKATRPLTITYNGGPGSSSVWLHIGGLAPRRVEMLDDGGMPRPPYHLVDNDYTWLTETDLVFVDPVDTGFSRATSEEYAKKAKSVDGDIAMVGEFIRLYLVQNARWTSPLFLCGESYGTFRSAGLAGYLIERGMAFSGVILISSILNMQTAEFRAGNDLPYQLFLPTYAATAWFHKRVSPELQALPIRQFLDEVEAWVEAEYLPALSLGDRLPDDRRQAITADLAKFTGLSESYLDYANLRPVIYQFCKELCRDQHRTVGRLDSRFTGMDRDGVGDAFEYDPSLNGIRPPYTSTINTYFRDELGFESDEEYHILRGLSWDWGKARDGYPDTSAALRDAFAKNPYMKVFVASGYYDLATPYYATMYTMSHLGLPPELRGNLVFREYETGHMVYIDRGALVQITDDVRAFYRDCLAGS